MKPESNKSPKSGRRAFTLAELLVVMAIIAIVIALIVPALGGSRNAARAAATQSLMKDIGNAVSTFSNDNSGQMPGPFTARQMGLSDNVTRGMSMAENVMLGLMGWQRNSSASANIQVGPSSNATIEVDPSLIGVPGAGGRQYFTPDKKYWVAQVAGLGQMAEAPHASVEGDPAQLPDVVDAWGTPLLMWVQDDTYITKPRTGSSNYEFARLNSGTGANGAKYYWAQNACFLTATATSKRSVNQTDANAGSLLSQPNANTATSMAGVLGNPNAPWRDPANLNAVPTVPLSGRAPFTVQSAGIDGYYLGRRDKGAKQFTGGIVTYGTNFAPNITQPIGPTNQWVDKNGKPTNIDVLAAFDDLFSYGGS
ncbi:MAG: prepilin-type N-terminal cleavage/methylation domain-containing protein [Phycisphaeraceae bacterium]|nr:prepilin-type N-terminal cleavage/methylation domain-containing protein [Phycisphaeraceae bacterium]